MPAGSTSASVPPPFQEGAELDGDRGLQRIKTISADGTTTGAQISKAGTREIKPASVGMIERDLAAEAYAESLSMS